MNYEALFKLSYGMYGVTTWDNGRPTGCTANSVMQITAEPPTLAISINHDNYTHGCIKERGRFAISVFTEQTEPLIIGTLGYQSGRDTDKFKNISYVVKQEMPVVEDACAYMVCEVIDRWETDTHTVFLGKVLEADKLKEGEAMTYAYYHKVIKGKSPKNAPTYVPEK